jgi:hypothetical protein
VIDWDCPRDLNRRPHPSHYNELSKMAYPRKPERDASAAIAGYVYQVNVTVQRWLNLGPNEHLELEAGEDIDIVRRARADDISEAERDVEQVHRPARPLTLRSKKARQAIVNFCGHSNAREGVQLRFRFVTTAKAAREAGAAQPGIVLWESVRNSGAITPDEVAAVEHIRQQLTGGPKPKGVSADEWENFKAILADASPDRLTDVIRSFEWAMEQGDAQFFRTEANRRLSEMRPGQSPAMIVRVFTHLFAYVFGLLSQTGPKVLTADSLRSELNASSVSEGDLLTAEWLLRRLDEIEGRLTELEETVNRHLSEEHPKTFLKLLLPVASREQARSSTSTRSFAAGNLISWLSINCSIRRKYSSPCFLAAAASVKPSCCGIGRAQRRPGRSFGQMSRGHGNPQLSARFRLRTPC